MEVRTSSPVPVANPGWAMTPVAPLQLVRHGHHFSYPLLLRLGQRRGHIFKRGQMLLNIGLGVLDGNSPLLIPPVRLRHHTAIDHGEPIVPPQVDVNGALMPYPKEIRTYNDRAAID